VNDGTRMERQLYLACKQGYVLCLRMPNDYLRLRNQATLCALRNAIATFEERSEEDVQNDFEYLAAQMNAREA